MRGAWLLLVCLVGISCLLSARNKLVRVSSRDSFYNTLARSLYSVVMFYDKSKDVMRDPELKRKTNDLEEMFASLSKNPDYVEAELMFMRVDVSRKDLAEIAYSLGVKDFPSFRLFLGGQMIKGVGIQGFTYRNNVQMLIDDHLADRMKQVMREKERKRERELEKAKISAYQNATWWGPWGPYASPYWYYPYWSGPYWNGPYWGYPYYARPYYGFYVGY